MKLNLVAARTGALWVREGVRAFFYQPMIFFSLFMVFMTAVALLTVLPVIGGVLGLMLVPATKLALMVATEQVFAARSAQLKVATPLIFVAALAAVRQRAKPLALLGLLFALAILAAIMAATVAALMFNSDLLSTILVKDQSALDVKTLESAAGQTLIWLSFALCVPVFLLFWHAPALIHWHETPVLKSLFFSMIACWRNLSAMAVYSLTWIAVALLVQLALGLLGALAMSVGGEGLAAAVMLGGSLALTTLFFCTNWFSFRDSFQFE